MPLVEGPLHEAELPSRGLVGDGEGVAADALILVTGADRQPAGVGLGRIAAVVDAQTVERRPDRESIGRGPRPLRVVGPVDADVEGDLGVTELGADLSGPRHRGSPQPTAHLLDLDDGVDVDLVAVALAACPGVAGDPAITIVDEPAIHRRIESGLLELVADVVQGDVGEFDDGCVPTGDEVPDRLGVVHAGTPPGEAVWQTRSHDVPEL